MNGGERGDGPGYAFIFEQIELIFEIEQVRKAPNTWMNLSTRNKIIL